MTCKGIERYVYEMGAKKWAKGVMEKTKYKKIIHMVTKQVKRSSNDNKPPSLKVKAK